MGPDREIKQLVLSKRFERHRLAAQTIYIYIYIHKTFEKTLHRQTCGVSPEAKLSDVSECCNASAAFRSLLRACDGVFNTLSGGVD